MKKNSVNLLTAICVAGILAGCSQADNKSATSTTSTSTGTATTTDGKPQVTTTVAPNGQKQIKISLESLPNDMTICTVGSRPITIGEYRRMLKLNQVQAQQNLSANAELRNNVYAQATKAGVTLTADEKQKLIDTAKASHKDFQAFLKEKNLTEEQFNKEVEQLGVVFKLSNAMIEEQLLSSLVRDTLLAEAASKDPNANAAANASYEKVKAQSNNFDGLKKTTGLSDDDIKQILVNAELARQQLIKIEQGIKITDKEVEDFYKKNEKQLKHNERIRLSRIVISAPEATAGPWVSVKDQVKKANPKLEGAELDKVVANVVTQQQQKALVLLGEAKADSKEFPKLANQNTDEPIGRTLKNGGDMGWQEKAQLVPQFADAVWTIPAGQVLPKLVKTNEGFSIIKVTAHEKPGTLTLPEVKNAITLKLKQDHMNKALQAWIANQSKVAKVEFAPKFVQLANSGKTPS